MGNLNFIMIYRANVLWFTLQCTRFTEVSDPSNSQRPYMVRPTINIEQFND